MADQKFQPGAKVQLVSGGPIMTVVDYKMYTFPNGMHYSCRWFDGKGELKQHLFTEAELKSAE